MKKLLKIVLVGIPVVVIVVVVGLFLSLNFLIKSSVERFGPKVTQTDVDLDSVRISPFSGKGEIHGLTIENPEGFKTANAFTIGQVRVVIDPASLRTNTIVIKEILVDAPEITYERSLHSSNLNELKKNVEQFAKRAEKQAEEKPAGEEPAAAAKKVIIDHFLLSNAKVRVSSTVLQGQAVTATVPTVELFDLGKGSGNSMTVAQAVELIFNTVTRTVFSAVPDVEGLLKGGTDAVRGVTGQATDTVRSVSDGASGLLKGVLGGNDKDE